MDRRQRFQRMWELADLAALPSLGGWTRKVAELEQHRANFGKVNEHGVFMVQTGRKTDFSPDRLADFFSCLAFGREKNALIVAVNCTPAMLYNYPDVFKDLAKVGVHKTDEENWKWGQYAARASGVLTAAFWGRVRKKRLLPRDADVA